MKIKTEINKWDLKRQTTECEKIFANKASDRGLISKYNKTHAAIKKPNRSSRRSAVVNESD